MKCKETSKSSMTCKEESWGRKSVEKRSDVRWDEMKWDELRWDELMRYIENKPCKYSFVAKHLPPRPPQPPPIDEFYLIGENVWIKIFLLCSSILFLLPIYIYIWCDGYCCLFLNFTCRCLIIINSSLEAL